MNRIRFFTTSVLAIICLFTSAQEVSDIHKKCYALFKSRKYREAKEIAQKLIFEDNLTAEEKSETYYIIGYSNRKENLFAESLEYYEKAIEATSSNDKKGKIYNNIIGSLIYMNLNDEAIREANKAIKLSELWSPVSLYNKSLAQMKLKDYAGAAETLEEGLKVCDDLENNFYKAKLYNQYGLMEQELFEYSNMEEHAKLAAQYFGYALEIKENTVEQGKAHHYLANLLLMESDTIGAVSEFKMAIDNQPNNQYLFHTLRDYGEYLFNSGDIILARQPIDSALNLFPKITLSGETLKIFFVAQDLGFQVPQFREYFDSYVEQREKTELAYAAYIGRQIKRENAQKVRVRNQKILITLTVIAIIILIIVSYKYRRKINSTYDFIKKFESLTK